VSHAAERLEAAPLFSIITAVFNGAGTIADSIRSVAAQSCRDFEYIVLDGASTDGTPAVLEEYAGCIDYWKSEPDSGIYNAWNKGLAAARGEWIAFLGAGDLYAADALQQYAHAIASLPDRNCHYISSRVRLTMGARVLRTIGAAWTWPAFSRHMTVAHVGSMHHRSLFEQYGRFNESYRICGDYELLLRPRDGLRAAFFPGETATMAFGGVSNSNIRLALDEQQRAKCSSGGRSAWRCALERRTAYIRDRARSLIWY
jgi:glycosyltransferase involved in cell wall biosynthesis